MDKKLIEKIREIVLPLLDHGIELYDVELRKEGKDLVLTVLIDQKGGVDLDTCVRVSEKVSKALDDADPIPNEYMLEVASAGAEKPLNTLEQYQAAIDEYILVQVKEPVETYDELVGYLREVNEERIVLEIKIKTRVKKVEIRMSNISYAMTCVKL